MPAALLGAFLLAAYLAGFNTISYDPTHRGLQHIGLYLLLFVLASNAVRTPRAISIVLAGICAGWLLCAAWAVFHYFVMLRGMRQILTDNPQLFEHYFGQGGGVMSPELKNRLESNRAFGTFLFPNALGAYLVLGIPILVVATRQCIGFLRPSTRSASAMSHPMQQWFVIGAFVAASSFVLGTLYFANDFIGASRPDRDPPVPGAYRPFLIFLPVAVLAGVVAAWITNRGGPRRLGEVLAAVGAPAGLVVSLSALWLSYSRGAMVALAAAAAIGAVALLLRRGTRGIARAAAIAAIGAYAFASTPGSAQDEIEGYRVPAMMPSDVGYSVSKFLKDQRALTTIDIEGSQRSVGDLAKLDSMRARVTYWQVGLRMLAAHPWTGVGLGNYRQAFLQYQFLGAGDVETAHNDFLQYFCETGLVGGPLFLAFWVYFGVWGALRIRREDDAAARRWMLGLYVGALAFAIHALVDFNFQNPSIAALAFIVAGLFYARCALTEPPARATLVTSPRRVRAVAVALTVLSVILTASVARLYFFELGLTQGSLAWRLYYVGDRKALSNRREVATKFLTELTKEDPDRKTPPYLTVRAARLVIPDLPELETIGTFGTRMAENPSTMRRLSPGEQVTDETFVFITNPRRAVELTTRNSEAIIKDLEGLDALYPHDPELANELFAWYELLFAYALDAPSKKRFAAEAERWAREGTERSPQVAWWWLNYARALWMRGSIEPGPPGLAYYFTGLDHYKHGHELFPASGTVAYFYAQALKQLGDELVRKGQTADGQRLVTESQAMFERANLLANYKQLVR